MSTGEPVAYRSVVLEVAEILGFDYDRAAVALRAATALLRIYPQFDRPAAQKLQLCLTTGQRHRLLALIRKTAPHADA